MKNFTLLTIILHHFIFSTSNKFSKVIICDIFLMYGWQAIPEINLYDGTGFPSYSYRIDKWKLSTEK